MRKFIPAILVIILFIFGCSGGGSVTTAPSLEKESANLASHTLWGLWQFTADPVKGTLDVVQMRMPDMHLNALPFLEPPALVNLTLESLEFNGNIIEADIGLRHPFLGLDEFTGFDVSGILITNGSVSGFSDSDLVMAGPGDTRLLNPDGYTRWWNPAEFPHDGTMFGYKDGLLGTPDSFADYSSTLNAYKFFCDDIDDPGDALSDVDIESRCVFSAGMQNVRHYTIELGNDGLIFNYAIDASWVFPNGDPPWYVPDDFAEEANRPEAWNISVTEVSNALWNDGVDNGGSLNLEIDLWDHYNAGLNSLYAESPGNFIPVGPLSPVGGGVGYSTYEIDITSATPVEGSIDILLIAECEEADYQGLLTGEQVAAYFIHTAQVGGQGDMPPVADAEIVTAEPWCPNDLIEFDASASYDPDGGSIVLYEWDFDGDGSYGDAYDSGTDVNPTKIYTSPGVYDVDVRVTDDESDTDTLDDPLVLSVGGPTWVDDDAVAPYDGTFDNPWPTIQDGINNLNTDCPGSGWVLVKAGTYTENITFISNLTVEGYSSPAPLIISPDGSSANLVNMGSYSNTTIKHFQIKPRTSGYGISSSGQNVTVDDIEFLDNPGGPTCSRGVYASSYSASGNVVNNVRVDGYHKSSATFIYVRGYDATITNCVILNLTFTAACNANVITAYGSTSGNPDYLVAKNVIGHITFSQPFASTQWVSIMNTEYCGQGTVRNNLIFDIDNNLGDTGWTWGIDAYRCTDATFEHNTISGISGPAWIYAFETSDYNTDPSGVTHHDHIITNLTAGIMNWRWAYLGRWDSTFTLPVDYSCAYNVGNAFSTYEQVVEGVGFTYLNPQFLNAAGDDYRVSTGSPCSGTAHDGTDMGAYGGTDPLTWLPN